MSRKSSEVELWKIFEIEGDHIRFEDQQMYLLESQDELDCRMLTPEVILQSGSDLVSSSVDNINHGRILNSKISPLDQPSTSMETEQRQTLPTSELTRFPEIVIRPESQPDPENYPDIPFKRLNGGRKASPLKRSSRALWQNQVIPKVTVLEEEHFKQLHGSNHSVLIRKVIHRKNIDDFLNFLEKTGKELASQRYESKIQRFPELIVETKKHMENFLKFVNPVDCSFTCKEGNKMYADEANQSNATAAPKSQVLPLSFISPTPLPQATPVLVDLETEDDDEIVCLEDKIKTNEPTAPVPIKQRSLRKQLFKTVDSEAATLNQQANVISSVGLPLKQPRTVLCCLANGQNQQKLLSSSSLSRNQPKPLFFHTSSPKSARVISQRLPKEDINIIRISNNKVIQSHRSSQATQPQPPPPATVVQGSSENSNLRLIRVMGPRQQSDIVNVQIVNRNDQSEENISPANFYVFQ